MHRSWPQFLDADGAVVQQSAIPVAATGRPPLWIVDPARRPFHAARLRVGTQGYFMEGLRRVAVCRVVALIELSPAIESE